MRALRVCFVITEDWYFWSHRRILAQYLVQRGCRVDVVTNLGKLKQQIESAGMIPHSVGLQRRGRNPFDEAGVVARMASLFRRIKPDLVHLVGMKPILYGSLAARIARVPATVCAIAGLGWLFTPGSFLKSTARRVVQTYFRRALSGRSHIRLLVQNTHHRDLLTATRMAKLEQIELVHGAGVDTDRFRVRREPDGDPVVVTHARMLWDKGIGELVEAARMVRRKSNCRFLLVGDPDPANPASIPRSQLEEWNSEGAVEWHGRRNDIPEQLANAHLACLPSYHEGFPLSLVEAASSGRAIVTTDIRVVVTWSSTKRMACWCREKILLHWPPRSAESLSNPISVGKWGATAGFVCWTA